MRLKELRQEHDKTQKEVADFLNVKQNTYSQICYIIILIFLIKL